MSSTERIQELHRQMQRVKQALEQQEALVKQRLEVESEHSRLKESLHVYIRRFHGIKDSNDAERQALALQIEKTQEQVKTLAQSKSEIDHKLDDLDEDFGSLFTNAKEQLIHSILEVNPQAKGAWIELEERFAHTSQGRDYVQSALDLSIDVAAPLHNAIETRRTQRSRGVMNLIFGRNPTVMVAQYLDKSLKAARLALDTAFSKRPEHIVKHRVASSLSDLEDYFGRFCSACEQPLALKHVDTQFVALARECEGILENLQSDLATIDGELDEIEYAMQEWLNRHTKEAAAAS